MRRQLWVRAFLIAALSLVCALSACSIFSAKPLGAGNTPSHAEMLSVRFLDVGQADAEFIELPNGTTMLIDAGNSDDGPNIVRLMKASGYNTIDILVATHPHADHIGGMAYVIEQLGIGSVYMPKVSDSTKTYEELLKAIRTKGLKISTVKAGVTLLDSDGLKVTFLAPVSSGYEDLNNESAVIKLLYKNTSFLFMGDAETRSENEILKSGADVRADVLKVGHHGSDSSTGKAFLQAVSPKIAVISVGAGNDYGHPDASTLTKLQKAGAEIYRTDQSGMVTVLSDGTSVVVTTEKKD